MTTNMPNRVHYERHTIEKLITIPIFTTTEIKHFEGALHIFSAQLN